MDREFLRLLNNYEEAAHALKKYRDKEFPPGTLVENTLTKTKSMVIVGSWYPDQVMTNSGHMSLLHLQKCPTIKDHYLASDT